MAGTIPEVRLPAADAFHSASSHCAPSRIILACMPWAPVQVPSIGLGMVKASLAQASIPSEVHYLNLEWYNSLWHWFALKERNYTLTQLLTFGTRFRLWPGECLFGAYYNSEDAAVTRSVMSEFLNRDLANFPNPMPAEFPELAGLIPEYLDRCVERLDISSAAVVGFSTTFCQLMPSLVLARHIKRVRPEVIVVFGGALAKGRSGEVLLHSYDCVDYICTGEGEVVFPSFARQVLAGRGIEIGPGMIGRRNGQLVNGGASGRVEKLDELPYPDFDEYYREVDGRELPPDMPLFLLMETTRGCWWGVHGRCVFCGYRGAGAPDHRRKSPARILTEFEYLVRRHPRNRLVFADANLCPEHYKSVFPKMIDLRPDLWMYGEIRPEVTKEQARDLARSQFHYLQPGIESLSTGMLRFMRKGTTALQNAACLRYLRETGIGVKWHILYGFPREDPALFEQTLEALRFLTHLDPPVSVHRLLLVNTCPALQEAAELGYLNPRPLPCYTLCHKLDSESVAALAVGFDYDYEDGRDPETYMRPIHEFVALWKAQPQPGELEHVNTGGGSGRIVDTRFNRLAEGAELDPIRNAVYWSCDSACTPAKVAASTGVAESRVTDILEAFCRNRWMMAEEGQYLSLALMR